MKNRIVPFVVFMIFLVSGFGLRFLWFYTGQKKIVEKEFIYKELSQDKGGANTPQEAWQKYLSALEKGNIEEALLYILPYNREHFRKLFEELSRAGLLKRYAKNHSLELVEAKEASQELEKNQKGFFFIYKSEKEIELAINPEIKEALEREWLERGSDSETLRFMQVFEYNPYNKKWYLVF